MDTNIIFELFETAVSFPRIVGKFKIKKRKKKKTRSSRLATCVYSHSYSRIPMQLCVWMTEHCTPYRCDAMRCLTRLRWKFSTCVEIITSTTRRLGLGWVGLRCWWVCAGSLAMHWTLNYVYRLLFTGLGGSWQAMWLAQTCCNMCRVNLILTQGVKVSTLDSRETKFILIKEYLLLTNFCWS